MNREMFFCDPCSSDWSQSLDEERTEFTTSELRTMCQSLTDMELIKLGVIIFLQLKRAAINKDELTKDYLNSEEFKNEHFDLTFIDELQ